MTHHHHKSNEEVEGDPETGHGRGMPRRPDAEKTEERLEEDREEVGLLHRVDLDVLLRRRVELVGGADPLEVLLVH
ncbi:hypothetical protein AB0L02_33500, partial [Streptomyces anulatus]|uniref:hypothetical protein n=1 Tax=Streptomyces anulatus TaxID=1892 RepID=UPI00342ABF40